MYNPWIPWSHGAPRPLRAPRGRHDGPNKVTTRRGNRPALHRRTHSPASGSGICNVFSDVSGTAGFLRSARSFGCGWQIADRHATPGTDGLAGRHGNMEQGQGKAC